MSQFYYPLSHFFFIWFLFYSNNSFVGSSWRFICLFYLYPAGLGPNYKINTINFQRYNAPLKLKGWKKIWIQHKCGVTGHYDKLLAVYRGTLKKTTQQREKEERALKSMLDRSIFESIEWLKTFLKIEKKFARRLPLVCRLFRRSDSFNYIVLIRVYSYNIIFSFFVQPLSYCVFSE